MVTIGLAAIVDETFRERLSALSELTDARNRVI
jgi:hypothetical protein